MKSKIISLFVLATTLFSCSSDNSSSLTNPNLLQRVDFFPGRTFETRWKFNDDGLLISITNPNNELIESFVYDSNNNVIQDTKYDSGSPTENYLITYDSSNKITSINSRSYNYNASENRYYYIEGNETFSCELNADGIVTHYFDFFDFPEEGDDIQTEFSFQYENGNLLSMIGFGSSLGEIEVHFNYGTVVNPLKNATLSVLKLKSIIEPRFFNTGISSYSIKETQSFSVVDPETHSFGMLFYPSNKIELLTQENFSNGVFESSLTNSYYYYQGDVLP
ncbi:hypothetical protein [Flavobacterium sp.]|uniref:hypothetical protein n=1 Tax=Flavobacterium sp. TaxID=239 RepID=UPI0025F3A415|nr:hypothetical protein [Flavobacterium sp.]